MDHWKKMTVHRWSGTTHTSSWLRRRGKAAAETGIEASYSWNRPRYCRQHKSHWAEWCSQADTGPGATGCGPMLQHKSQSASALSPEIAATPGWSDRYRPGADSD